jgi:hypothetical protein
VRDLVEKKFSPIKVEDRTLRMVSTLISDYPELGYKTVEEFVNKASLDLLKRKGLEIGELQTWMKKRYRKSAN